jgi:hypothetical protein
MQLEHRRFEATAILRLKNAHGQLQMISITVFNAIGLVTIPRMHQERTRELRGGKGIEMFLVKTGRSTNTTGS